jgi:hypothetical protein
MTRIFAGGAYVVAVMCVFALGRPLTLARSYRLVLTGSFALATVAVTYSRHVNDHILLLAVAAVFFWQLAWLALEALAGSVRWRRVVILGLMSGAAYAIDPGTGPLLLVCAGTTVGWRCRRVGPVFVLCTAALPGLVTHHILNYAVAGTLKPAGANPEYFQWPGSPFNPANMTGVLHHSLLSFPPYAASMLFGERGFLGHNLPLFLAVPALIALVCSPGDELPEVVCAVIWAGGTWLVYALASNNLSGPCCSIRWFVPLLAPAYFVLAVFLRRWPEYVADLLILSGWGGLLLSIMYSYGPFVLKFVPYFWPIQGAALLSWLGLRLARLARGHRLSPDSAAEGNPELPGRRAHPLGPLS